MNAYQLHIPQPCHQSWQAMSPNEQGRFCSACAKTVVDFSKMTDAELLQYFETYQANNICGRIHTHQLNRPLAANTNVTMQQPGKLRPLKKYSQWLAALLIFLFKGSAAKAQGAVNAYPTKDTTLKPSINKDIPIRLGGIRRVLPSDIGSMPALLSQVFITNKNKEAIPNATVILLPQNKVLIADSSGKINLGLAHSVKALQISAAGYQSQRVELKNIIGNHVELEKQEQALEEIVVVAKAGKRTISCTMVGSMQMVQANHLTQSQEATAPGSSKSIAPNGLISPNPAKAGEPIQLIIHKNIAGYSITNASGAIISRQTKMISTGKNRIDIPAYWSNGTYIISLFDSKQQVIQSLKLLLM